MRLTPERWSELEPQFDALLDRPPDERDSYLRELALRDAALARDLRALLESETGTDELDALHRRAPALFDALRGECDQRDGATEAVAGREIGPYRLLSVLGRGGMSVVYLAERTDGKLDQQVAVKVMHWLGGRDARRRFQREKQTLARLDHPSVTRVFDAGFTDDGLPYFVMERIEGSPITEYAERGLLSTRDRVRLFLHVCDGVHSAHQNLVVHRDLKPDNVWVTREGHVKILDFGIAKWLEQQGDAGATLLTQKGDGLLTPQYASPEQFLDAPITTASDVYSLGLLLYELLTGSPPYDLSHKLPTEQRKLVCEEDPQPPSQSVHDPLRRREIRGDLETIVLKALSKDPERRYPSASALRNDLRRYLDGRPIEAAPDSLLYRTRKFVARNRIGVGVGLAATLALVAGIGGIVWQSQQIAIERDRARVEALHAREVSDFLIRSLELANDWETGSTEDVTVKNLWASSVDRVKTELADQPDVQQRLYATMAQVYNQMGDNDRAIELGTRALHLADSLDGPGSFVAAKARYEQANWIAKTDWVRADSLFRDAIAVLRTQSGTDWRIQLAYALELYGIELSGRALLDSALLCLEEALAIREAVYDTAHLDLARSHHHLAGVLSNLNRPDAGDHYAKALELWKAMGSEDHPNYGSTLNNWAIFRNRMGDPDSAEVLYLEAIESAKAAFGPRHRLVADRLNNLSQLAISQGQFEEAEGWLRQALEIFGNGEHDKLRVGAIHLNLGNALTFQDRYDEAKRHFEMGRRLFVARYGEDHPYPAVADSYLGRNDYRAGLYEPAERRLWKAMKVLEGYQPALANRLALAEAWYGTLLLETRSSDGLGILQQAAERAREHLPESNPNRAEVLVAYGIGLLKVGRTPEGMENLQEGFEVLAERSGDRHPIVQNARRYLHSSTTSGI